MSWIKSSALPLATIPSVCSEAMKTSHTYCWPNTQKQLCNSEAHTEARGQVGVLVYALTHIHSILHFSCVCLYVSLQEGWAWGAVLKLQLTVHQISLHLLHFLSDHVPYPSPPSTLDSPPFTIILLSLLLRNQGLQMVKIIQFSLLVLWSDFLLKTEHFVVGPQCIITVRKSMIMQLGLSGVWRTFFLKLGDGESCLVGSVSQSEGRHKEGEGEWDGADIQERGKGGRWRERCMCKSVCSPFACTSVSAILTAWNQLWLNPLTIRTLFVCSVPNYTGVSPSKQ